jgi:4-amino-4-deoxy-L-arabinose transferase-like glycosyltransferase
MSRSALVLYCILPAYKIATLWVDYLFVSTYALFYHSRIVQATYLIRESGRGWGYTFAMGGRNRSVWPVAIGLYGLAVVLLLVGLASHPGYTFNWENNTLQGLFPFVEQPSLTPFHVFQGLMTDGGSSPWVVLPAWVGFGVGGASLLTLRLPVALVAALAVPLLYILGRKLFGRLPDGLRRLKEPVSVLAALLLALSPVYLLYSRTATAVGVSLVPALLTILALLRVLERPDLWWRVGALLGTLVLGAYGYAPVRFLWPMCVGLLVLEAFVRWKDRAQRLRLFASALVLVLVMAGIITALDFDHEHDPIISVGYYYAGRGEQIANLIVNADTYNHALGNTLVPVGEASSVSPGELAWNLIVKNAGDMANLFLDRDTTPAPVDYWNPHGRLMPWWMLPLLLVGLGWAAWLGRRRTGYRWRALVLLLLGFTLPLLLTSQVHIGRLIFAVPLICLLVALGVVTTADYALRVASYLVRRSRVAGLGSSRRGLAFCLVCMAVLVGGVAVSTWRDYSVDMASTYEMEVTRLLMTQVDAAKARDGGVALVTNGMKMLTLEEINSNQYRLALRSLYRYYNIATGDVDPRYSFSDTRPPLYIGGLLDKLAKPDSVPGYCKNIYYVTPDLLPQFKELIAEHSAECPAPIEYAELP